MLTPVRRTLHLVQVATLVAVGAIVALGAAGSPAAAADGPLVCNPPAVIVVSGGSYSCTVPGDPGDPGEPGDDGSTGGTAEPTCQLDQAGGTDYSDKNRGPNYCIGEDVCFDTDIVVPFKNPDGEKPNEDSKARMTWCYATFVGPPAPRRAFWTDDEEPPTLLEQAQEAIGNIDVGEAKLEISPANRTLVYLDTWFWLDGPQQQVSGSSAFGLVAIATFSGMDVDPGDGSSSFPCPLVTSADEAKASCSYNYRRSSNGGSATVGGRPAYEASITSTYNLRFEVNGNPVDVPGAQLTLEGPAADAALRVDELQSRVTRLG